MAEKSRTIGFRVTEEEYSLIENISSRYELEVSKFLRAIIFEIFLNRSLLDRFFGGPALSEQPSLRGEDIVDDIFKRLERRDDESIKIVDHIAKELDYFRRLCLAQYNLLGNIGYRLCQKGYEKQFQEFLDEIKQRFGL